MGDMCIICLNDDLTSLESCITQCNHILCKSCLDQVFETSNKCPMCRGDITSYFCDNIETRILYRAKKKVRNIQTIIEQRVEPSKIMTYISIGSLVVNGILGYFISQC